MAPTGRAVLDRTATAPADPDLDFTLDVHVVEALVPVPALMRSTSDGCGSSCAGPCASYVEDPAEPMA